MIAITKALAKKALVFLLAVIAGYASSVEKADRPLFQLVDKGTMKASWYGPGFHGRTTANGEVYNMHELTAAHKSLKFGTLLKVTNPKNDSSVIVRINDRGPYIKGRQLDLSKEAAKQLDFIKSGVTELEVKELIIRDTLYAEIQDSKTI
jgi:rare lipoprotein A